MRSIVRGVVALFAAFLMMDVANAAPTIVSPADYATVKTMTDAMHDFLFSDAMLDPDTFTYTKTESYNDGGTIKYRYVVNDERKAYMAEYNANTIPVVLEWSAAVDHSGDYAVVVKRVKDGKTVFTQTTSSTTATFYDPEVGRNYVWTVTDNTGSVTGHFYTDRRGPRIIYSETSDLTNTRDLGGWSTTDGKVVKQGLIYRAPEWEWSAVCETETGNYFEMPYLRDVLGIKLEVDLRAMNSNTGSGVTGQTYVDYFKCGSVYESTIDSSIPRFFCEQAGATVSFPSYSGLTSTAANRKAVWHTFTNFCDVVKADGSTKPVIFHCSHGKDRTGSLAYVLLGVLGVPRDSIERDWALSWYSEGKYDVYMNSNGPSKTVNTANSWLLNGLINAINNNYSGATLKDKCYNYLLACASSASVSEANARALIDNYISIMLEEPEAAAVDPSKISAPVAVTGLVYNGSELTGVVAGVGYTLTGNTAMDAGDYTAVATLAEGYKWADGSTDNKEISWSIAKATNEWTTEPSISLTEWTVGETAGVLTAGVAKFGEVTSSMTELPTEVGSYTITYTVEENNNYNGLTKTISFEIKAAVVVEPDPEEPDPEEPGTGGEEPSEKPKLAIDAKFGYVLTGLGELGDQAVVVFTNSTEAATWQAPRSLKNVEILVVGGGGGGGGHYYSSTAKNCQGGAGGGAGAVVTGFIKNLASDQVVNVTVGAGGAGGTATTSATTGAGKGGNGGNTILKVGDVTYVTAYGGGGDGGYNSTGVANGGSNSGVRGTKTARALKSVTVVGADAADLVFDIVSRVNKGGGGYSTSSGYPGAGGGGAGGQGGGSPGSAWGGQGGFGYVSNITGSRVVYGAGGGGGSGKSSGAGSVLWDGDEVYLEGAGVSPADADGTAGLPNQGGGGGGGSYEKNGGAGGSGIVILRFAYSEIDIPVDASADILPLISDKVYTGEVLSSGLVETYAYTVEELNDCVNVGAKVVRATLNEGYVWADGTTERYKDFAWNILKQDNNVWVTAPFINVDSWGQTYTGNVIFHKADPLVGELIATIAKDGGEAQSFNGVLPTEPGTYKLIYKVEETSNYSLLYWEKTFKIYESETFAGGYKVYGLGENGDEVAVVFTSTTDWTVPANLKNVQFLAVGGGGGGGADTNTSGEYQGGAGGGGGGVITGVIKEFSANSTVTITVGAGGKAGDNGVANSGYGAGSTGAESSIALGATKIVTAKGGGRDAGASAKGKYTDGKAGGAGGSGGGGRPNKAGGAADAGSVDAAYVLNSQKYANAGGAGCTVAYSNYGYGAAGGGGGATEAGGNGTKVDEYKGGDGGEGLACDITGALLVYGSGGGGSSTWGSAGVGGTGAGDGVFEGKGKDALANQGGGGGGGSRNCDGGAGGSGIVVLRYVEITTPTVGGVEIVVDETGKITNITTANDGNEVVGELDLGAFAGYYSVSVTDGVLNIALNPEVATPVINETASDEGDAIVVTDDAVTLGVTNTKKGLWYGAQAYSDPACAEGDKLGDATGWTKATADGEAVTVTATKPDADKAFFKVVVDDQDHTPPATQE